MKKLNPSIIGLLQAIGIAIYCALVVATINYFGKIFFAPPGFWGSVFRLMLWVFSAAVSGSSVFGYPAYLALNKRIKRALSVLAFTALYSLGIILIIVILITAF